MDIDTQVQDAFDFPVQHFVGKAVFRDPVAGHTAQFGHGVVDCELWPNRRRK